MNRLSHSMKNVGLQELECETCGAQMAFEEFRRWYGGMRQNFTVEFYMDEDTCFGFPGCPGPRDMELPHGDPMRNLRDCGCLVCLKALNGMRATAAGRLELVQGLMSDVDPETEEKREPLITPAQARALLDAADMISREGGTPDPGDEDEDEEDEEEERSYEEGDAIDEGQEEKPGMIFSSPPVNPRGLEAWLPTPEPLRLPSPYVMPALSKLTMERIAKDLNETMGKIILSTNDKAAPRLPEPRDPAPVLLRPSETLIPTSWFKKENPSADIADAIRYLGVDFAGGIRSGAAFRAETEKLMATSATDPLVCGACGGGIDAPGVNCPGGKPPMRLSQWKSLQAVRPQPAEKKEYETRVYTALLAEACICFGPRSLRCRAKHPGEE